jgi:predicted phage terminase large subunit-like protein
MILTQIIPSNHVSVKILLHKNGPALWPDRYSVNDLENIRLAVGTRNFTSQYQGKPSPAEGDTLKRDWWKFWTERPALTAFDSLIQSWDMTFRETARGSYVVGQVWGAINADRYLLAQTRLRTDFPGSVAAMRELSADWPLTREKLVENKANGPAIVATLQHEIPGLIEVQPEGGKEARANAVAWQIEAGNVYLPDPKRHPWVADFIEECAAFPNGVNDDQVDAMTQALVRMQDSGGQWEGVTPDVAEALRGMGL